MKKQVLSTLAIAVLMGSLASAALAQNVAIVNGVAVPKERMDSILQQVSRSGRQITPEMQTQLHDQIINLEVWAQEGHKLGLDATDDYKNQLELTRQTILARELFGEFEKKNPVTDEEAKADYDKQIGAAVAVKEYHARHILVATEKEAKDVLAKLKKGAKFEDLAKKLSKDPGSGAKGGDLDWAGAGNYVKEFADAMTALAKGETTKEPVKSQLGYHIIRLEDVRDAQLPKFEEAKPQIVQQLRQQKMTKYQEELRAKAKVE